MPKDNIFIIGFNNKSQKTLISQINDTFKKNEVIHLNGNEDFITLIPKEWMVLMEGFMIIPTNHNFFLG